MGNIEYNALDDLCGNFSQLFEKDNVLINGWDEMIQESTEHDEEGSTGEGNILLLISAILLEFVSEFRGQNSYKEGRM